MLLCCTCNEYDYTQLGRCIYYDAISVFGLSMLNMLFDPCISLVSLALTD